MDAPLPCHTLGVTIARRCDAVYAFLAVPENWAAWASGLGASLRRQGDCWLAATPDGEARVRFTEPNVFGVLDHTVEPAAGGTVHVPMRVVPNGSCSEVLVTVFRQPSMSEDRFAADLSWVTRDLHALKDLLEESGAF